MSRRKPLVCANRHRWSLWSSQLSVTAGPVACPRCGVQLQVSIESNLAAAEKRRQRHTQWTAATVAVLLFPAIVLLTWLSVSRWSIVNLVVAPDGSTLAIAQATIDGSARIQLVELQTGRETAAAGSRDQRIAVWKDFKTIYAPVFVDNRELLVIQNTKERRPGKKGLGTVSWVKRWDLENPQPTTVIGKHPVRIRDLAYDRPGQSLLIADRKLSVLRWNATSGEEIGQFQLAAPPLCLQLQAAILATGTVQGHLELWNIDQDAQHKSIEAHHSLLMDLAFNRTGSQIVTVGGFDQMVKIWETQSGENLASWKVDLDWLNCVAFSPDERFIAVGGGGFGRRGEVQIWDIAHQRQTASFEVETNSVICVAYSADGRELLAGSGHSTSLTNWHRQGRLYRWKIGS